MPDFLAVFRLSPKAIGILHGVVVAWMLVALLRWIGLSL